VVYSLLNDYFGHCPLSEVYFISQSFDSWHCFCHQNKVLLQNLTLVDPLDRANLCHRYCNSLTQSHMHVCVDSLAFPPLSYVRILRLIHSAATR
jgi:hypothetical protein